MTAIVHVPRPEDDPEHRGPDAATGQTVVAARKVAIARRRTDVAELILLHVPQREIARRLGCGLGTVSDDVKAVKAMWAERAGDAYDAHVARELAKLDLREQHWLPKAIDGDEKADQRCQAIAQERAKLLGLYKPIRFEGTVHHDLAAEKERGLRLVREAEDAQHRRAG